MSSSASRGPIYFHFGNTNATAYHKSEYDRFVSDSWLHDTTIDLHSDYVHKMVIAPVGDQKRIELKDCGVAQVLGWRGVEKKQLQDLLRDQVEHTFFPINQPGLAADEGTHWSLLYIHLPTNRRRYDNPNFCRTQR